jgi:hypothetical protein
MVSSARSRKENLRGGDVKIVAGLVLWESDIFRDRFDDSRKDHFASMM